MPESISCNLCSSDQYQVLADKTVYLGLPAPLQVVRCQKCGLVYMNPRFTPDEHREQFVGSRFYEAYLPRAERMMSSYKGTYELLEHTLGRQGALLEIGCATGELSRYMAQQGLAVSAVDYSASMLSIAARSNTNGICYHKADVMKLPFTDNSFDLVIAASVINIISDPMAALAEMHRVCRHGGRMAILVPKEGIGDSSIMRLITDLGLKGFSRTALMTWHSYAPKVHAESLVEYCHQTGIRYIQSSAKLNGMILTVTGVKE